MSWKVDEAVCAEMVAAAREAPRSFIATADNNVDDYIVVAVEEGKAYFVVICGNGGGNDDTWTEGTTLEDAKWAVDVLLNSVDAHFDGDEDEYPTISVGKR
jgi:NAD(P)H-hydrate repair Nnr-like enzyme with NAD(P)H-hydrate epimerase domain